MDASIIPQSVLDQVMAMDIYFEHASVGGNIMSGMTAMATANSTRYGIGRNGYSTGVEPTADERTEIVTWFGGQNGLVDFQRGNPGIQSKVDYFDRTMTTTGFSASVDVAMFKFCYIDTGGTAQAAFDTQRTVMDALESAYPGTIFVWWTMPVTTSGSQRMDDFNNMIRNYCNANNKVLFDIADIECHNAAGELNAPSGFEALVSGYAGIVVI